MQSLSPRIFIVDDDVVFHSLVALSLEDTFPRLSVFSTGESFLDHLNAGDQPDAVVLDYHLGSMNGLDILLGIRKDHPDIRVIVLSAQEDVEVAVSALKAGAYDYIVKNARALDNLKRSLQQLEEVDNGFVSWNA